MRHVLVHGYFEVDLDLVWSVVEHELAALRSAIALMVDRPDPDSVPNGHEM
jgi:uncharacterized protein with HEPN domain